MTYAFNRRHMTPFAAHPGAAAAPPAMRLALHLSYLGARGHRVDESLTLPLAPGLHGVCAAFARGTLIATPDGATAVEDLAPGDMIATRDAGAQPLRWIACTCLSLRGTLDGVPVPAALRVTAGAFGPLLPEYDVILHESVRLPMPQHAEESGVLAALADLVDDSTIVRLRPPGTPEFFNLAFDRHQIVSANGLAVESFHPASLAASPAQTRHVLARLFPWTAGDPALFGPPCRPTAGASRGSSAA